MQNNKGKWIKQGNVKVLVEPSKEYVETVNLEFENSKAEKEKQKIKTELEELDKEIPRIIEDLMEFVGFKPHASKDGVLKRKKELRNMLKSI